jgi:hypothetical protein
MNSTDDQKTGDSEEPRIGQIPEPMTDDVVVVDDSNVLQTEGPIEVQNQEHSAQESTEGPQPPVIERLTESEPREISVEESLAEPLPPAEADLFDLEEHKRLLAGTRRENQFWQQTLTTLYYRQRATLAPGIPVLVAALVAAALMPYFIGTDFWELPLWRVFPVPYSPSLSLCSLLLIAVLPAYYFWTAAPISNAQKSLHHTVEQLERLEVSTETGKRAFLNEKLRYLTKRAAKVFFESPDRRTQAALWRREANNAFSDGQLDEAQALINSIDELVLRESREQADQKTWQWMAVGIMFLYIALLAVFAIYTDAAQANEPYIFGIPLGVIVWGATGSLAAILYKFYTAEDRVRLAHEVRWLIARPIIGIIMAGLSYLTLVSGFVLLGAASTGTESAAAAPIGRIEIYWIFAFLAGFSDKFYLGIIDLLVAKTLPTSVEEADAPTANSTQVAVETATLATENGTTEKSGVASTDTDV